MTTAELAAALPTGFSSSVWGNAGNQTTPYLLAMTGFGTVSGSVYLGTDTGPTPTVYGLIQNMTQLRDINSTGLSGNYVLTGDLDNGSAEFTPIGSFVSPFTGTFDGQGHTVSNLYQGALSDTYWDTTTTGISNGVGGGLLTGTTGLDDSNMMQSSNFTGFDFTNLWTITNGTTKPGLR